MHKGGCWWAGIGIVFTIFCFCGDNSTNPQSFQAGPVARYVLNAAAIAGINQVIGTTAEAGWKSDTIILGDSTTLNQVINGGEMFYNDLGMSRFLDQKTRKGADTTADLMVMDFVTPQAAVNAFNHKVTKLTSTGDTMSALGGYSKDSVAVYKTDYFHTVVAHIGRFYFELAFSVNGDAAATESNCTVFVGKYETISPE